MWQIVDAGAGYAKIENKKHPLQCLYATTNYTSSSKKATNNASIDLDLDNNNELWTIKPVSTPLPIQLTLYKAQLESNNVKVEWQITNPMTVDYFEVLSSINGIDFKLLQTQKPVNNTSNLYAAWDEHPTAGVNYYRLVVYNKDSSKQVLETKTVEIGRVEETFSIYPNPASTQFNLVLSKVADKDMLVTIRNMVGKTILSRSIPTVAGQRTYPFSINKIESGIYLVEIIGSNYCKSLKLVIR